ncbi:NADPH-dependent F420 reductase [Kocuria flava]|uniref:Diguanylate cyclase n=1 Tax=Kocuria flava TaxID=446860 RepID=A0A2N4T3G9_9MICC|nr:NADPH-dependent F420 reductase [Kocuria flava]PLC12770.1 diguanylate cyclase [Kocuria flava]
MARISILGTGSMGQAISTALTRGGHDVELIGSGETDRAVTGEIVVLAVPYPALAEIAATRGQQLAGRIVVDITNPVDFASFDSLTVPADSSATAELAATLPGARVLKAFNTTFAATLASGTVGENPTTVLIAGDDAEAKAALAEAVTASGLRAVDAGALSRARELESLGFLQITLAAAEKISWTAGFALVP